MKSSSDSSRKDLRKTATNDLYAFLSGLPRYDFYSMQDQLPPNGVYFFFEQGETVQIGDRIYDRVTRVGTHIKPGRLPARIQQHFGNKNSLGGSKNASIFRKHLGAALLNRQNPDDNRIEDWLKQGSKGYREVEDQISQLLRDDFSFACLPIDDYNDRKPLARGLIALLAQLSMGSPSDTWLGNFSTSEAIRQSGLWNIEHIQAEPLGNRQLKDFLAFAQASH